MPNLGRAVVQIRRERDAVQQEIDQLDKAISTLESLNGSGRTELRGGKRHLSAAARKRIADAQKARWAKWKVKQKRAA